MARYVYIRQKIYFKFQAQLEYKYLTFDNRTLRTHFVCRV